MAIQLFPNNKNDLITSMVQAELREKAVLLPTISDMSGFAGKGSKSVSFPKLGSFTVENRAFGAAGSEQAVTEGFDTITLDRNAYISFVVDSADEIQTTVEARTELLLRAGSAMARYVDTQILGVLNTVASLNINAAVAQDITRDDILEMRRHLMENNADMNQVFLVVPPAQEEAMLKIAEFSQADIYGSAVIPNGMIGRVYGVPVIISNLLGDAGQAYMYERSGIAIAFQKSLGVGEQPEVAYGSDARKVAIDQLFGVDGMQLGVNGALATESPLVAKLKD